MPQAKIKEKNGAFSACLVRTCQGQIVSKSISFSFSVPLYVCVYVCVFYIYMVIVLHEVEDVVEEEGERLNNSGVAKEFLQTKCLIFSFMFLGFL